MTWTAPHALDVMASHASTACFVWTPLAALAVAALLLVPRAARVMTRGRAFTFALLAMVALQVYVAGSVESWTVAGAFGQRRFVGLTALLVVGLAAGLAVAGAWGRRLGTLAIVLGVWWNLGVMAQFGAGLMDRQRLEPARIAYTTFVVIAAAGPRLALPVRSPEFLSAPRGAGGRAAMTGPPAGVS